MVVAGLAVCLALGTFAADPVVSDVVVHQRWPWSRLVDIEYKLDCGGSDAEAYMMVNAYNGSESSPLGIPLASLSGDLYKVKEGSRRIVWDPAKTGYTNAPIMNFRVALTPTNQPLYVIVDLTQSVGATNQIAYIYPGDASLETYDRWTNVWFGVTNGTTYKTDKLVLRRVSAGTFQMGDAPGTTTTVGKDFYVGVFAVTEAQWCRVMGGTAAYPARSKGGVSSDDIRGSTNNVPPVDWPATGTFVSPSNFLGRLRAKTGIDTFELPTPVQREYLCRAGTTTVFNDGDPHAVYTKNGTEDLDNNGNTNKYLNAVGWYQFNSGGYIHPGGEKLANCWGIYDTNGGIYEWCLAAAILNWEQKLSRPLRGGCFISGAANCRSAAPDAYVAPSLANSFYGFRVVMTLPQ